MSCRLFGIDTKEIHATLPRGKPDEQVRAEE